LIVEIISVILFFYDSIINQSVFHIKCQSSCSDQPIRREDCIHTSHSITVNTHFTVVTDLR